MSAEASVRALALIEAYGDAVHDVDRAGERDGMERFSAALAACERAREGLASYVAALESVVEAARPIVRDHQQWGGDHGDGCYKCVLGRELAAVDATIAGRA